MICNIDTTKLPPLTWRTARIPKKDGSLRTLHIPNDELKEAQKAVLQYLYQWPELRPVQAAVGFVPNRRCMTGITQHFKDSGVVIGMDIKSFFDNVSFEDSARELANAGVPATMIEYIRKICLYEGTLAQGAPTSPYLANIAMRKFDMFMLALASKRNMTYTRYADDITLSTNYEQPRVFEALPSYLVYSGTYLFRATSGNQHFCRLRKGRVCRLLHGVELLLHNVTGMQINRKKTRVATHNSPSVSRRVTGVVISNNNRGYNAPRRYRLKVRSMCHHLYMDVLNGGDVKALKGTWRKLQGCVRYCDDIRKYSATPETSGTDTFINLKEYNFLERMFA